MLSTEFGFYDSREDRDGVNPGIENSQLRFLVSFQQPFGDELTLTTQYYVERMLDVDAYRGTLPAGFGERAGTRQNVTRAGHPIPRLPDVPDFCLCLGQPQRAGLFCQPGAAVHDLG